MLSVPSQAGCTAVDIIPRPGPEITDDEDEALLSPEV